MKNALRAGGIELHSGCECDQFPASKDGRFLIPTLLDSGRVALTAMVNWPEGLKK
jgi:hypothetical protein